MAARHWGTAAVICVLGAVLYAQTLDAPFVFDDFPSIVKNPYVIRFEPSFDGIAAVVRGSPSPRPVANLSFALNHWIGGLDVTGYHLVNVVVHLTTALLVYAIALQWLRCAEKLPDQAAVLRRIPVQPAAALAALIFVAHPVQVQSVTYVVQRMTGLATLFYLAALLLYGTGRLARERGPRWRRFGLCFACWLLALGSKQIAVTLPAAIFLIEWFFFRDLSARWLRAQLPGMLAAAAICAALLFWNLDVLNLAGYEERTFSLEERLWTQLRVVVWYVSLLLWPLPSRLNLAHDFPVSHSLLDPASTLVCAVAIAAALFGAARIARRWRLLSFAVAWYFLHLALESSVLPLELVFEHRLYLPSVAPIVAATALGLGAFAGSGSRTGLARAAALAASAAIVLALGIATLARNRTWSEPLSLWTDVAAKSPRDARAHFNLGVALGDLRRFDEAISHHETSLRLDTDNAKAHNGLGVALAGQGRYLEAVRHFAASVRSDPTDPEARANLKLAVERMQSGSRPPTSDGASP